MNKRHASLLMALAMTVSAMMPGQRMMAAETGYVTDAQLTAAVVDAPAKDTVIPDANQYEYQKQELAAFCHFGPNTFNEIEWGEHYGNRTPDDIFTLETNFDADQLVSSLKNAGFQKLIVTAKHHDGFCIWNSAYTEYDVESTSYAGYNYDNMGGDILAEISAACTAHDMDMGLYLSPWDIHDESYGYYDENHQPTDQAHDAKDYNEYYNNQLQEILGNPKYGNAGHFKEVWMDGAKGSGANAQEYNFQKWFDTIQKNEGKQAGFPADCMLFGAESYSTVRWIGNENGYANEETWSKSKINRENNTIDSNRTGAQGTFIGFEDGNQWTVPEVDARITSGWFWGTQKCAPKSISDLGNMYFNSVGHNAPLLLNVPPNNQGNVDRAILDRVAEFGENISQTFQLNQAQGAAASATEVRGNALSYKPGNVLDGRDDTYWTVNQGTTTATLELDLRGRKIFDVVSIEEAIAFGQRIKEFTVEYSLDGGAWKTFDQGTTIGAKRLCRKAPVTADKLRITVTTTSAEPMLSEVGVFKASEGFEKAKGAPAGMEVIDIEDSRFTFANGWHPETGDQYLNGTNTWANAGTSLDVTFNGTKIYLIGTKDPNHGTANITIDGQSVGSIDTNASPRAVGQILFASEDLADGPHTLHLETTNKAIGIEGAFVINNGGKGMIGIEQASYTMDEQDFLDVKLVRVGGTTGEVTVNFAPNPGSAIQDDYNTELKHTIVFRDGDVEHTARVETRRNTRPTGDQYFTVALSTMDPDLILGFHNVARINIIDAEGFNEAALNELLAECRALNKVNYTAESWQALETAMQTAEQRLEQGGMSGKELRETYNQLSQAKAGLVVRQNYTPEDRFVFPETANTAVTLEAELLERHNNTQNDNNWPLQITSGSWASNGKFLNCLNSNDQAKLYYTAKCPGTYSVVVTYRSGDPKNAIFWEEAGGKITAGNVTAGASDEAGATHTAAFELVVTNPGNGVLVFRGGEKNAPQIDKFDITAKEIGAPVEPEDAGSDKMDHITVAVTAGDQMDNHAAGAVNDQNANSFWSTNWGSKPSEADRPNKFWVQMDLGERKPVAGVRVLPRQGTAMGDENGTPTKFKIKVSDDGVNWTDVLTAEKPANVEGWRDWYIVRFDHTVNARYVRYEALNTYSDKAENMDLHMALAEIRAIKPAETAPFEVVSSNVVLGNSLAMKFTVNAADLKGITDARAVFTKINPDGTREPLTVEQGLWKKYEGDPLYYIEYKQLSAKEMSCKLELVIYDSSNKALSKVYTTSIQDYAEKILTDPEFKDEALLKTTVVDMLNYGTAAQVHFGYDLDRPANAILTKDQQALATQNVTIENKMVRGQNYVTTSLSLDSNIVLNLYFKGITKEMEAEVFFVNADGTETFVGRYLGTEFGESQAYQAIGVPVDDLAIADGKKLVKCVVKNGEQVAAETIDSVESYAARVLAKSQNENLKNLMHELMKFVDSSSAYFAAK